MVYLDPQQQAAMAKQRQLAAMQANAGSQFPQPPTNGGILAATGATPQEVQAAQPPTGMGNAGVDDPDIGGWMQRNFPGIYGFFTGAPNPYASNGASGTTPAAAATMDPSLPDTAPIPYEASAATADSPTPAAATPTIEDQLKKYRQIVDAIYPQRDTSPVPDQVKADAAADNEMKRTKLMAQLAMASGIVAGAGYPDVAKGFAAAGSVYDKGFSRYHQALQEAADRQMQSRNLQYGDQVNRQEAAYKLYADQQKTGRDAVEKDRKEHMDFLKSIYGAKTDAMMDPDRAKLNDRAMRAAAHYQQTGEYIDPFAIDVKDQ